MHLVPPLAVDNVKGVAGAVVAAQDARLRGGAAELAGLEREAGVVDRRPGLDGGGGSGQAGEEDGDGADELHGG
ncbi:hypothetical protein PG996_010913 [Apiospora saccharicola]|uniref:Uncharacterized protein n=1 Tax=Apiospora saccharicola TaxID=335842 RepID=A0ABR1UPZ9_9PEZI